MNSQSDTISYLYSIHYNNDNFRNAKIEHNSVFYSSKFIINHNKVLLKSTIFNQALDYFPNFITNANIQGLSDKVITTLNGFSKTFGIDIGKGHIISYKDYLKKLIVYINNLTIEEKNKKELNKYLLEVKNIFLKNISQLITSKTKQFSLIIRENKEDMFCRISMENSTYQSDIINYSRIEDYTFSNMYPERVRLLLNNKINRIFSWRSGYETYYRKHSIFNPLYGVFNDKLVYVLVYDREDYNLIAKLSVLYSLTSDEEIGRALCSCCTLYIDKSFVGKENKKRKLKELFIPYFESFKEAGYNIQYSDDLTKELCVTFKSPKFRTPDDQKEYIRELLYLTYPNAIKTKVEPIVTTIRRDSNREDAFEIEEELDNLSPEVGGTTFTIGIGNSEDVQYINIPPTPVFNSEILQTRISEIEQHGITGEQMENTLRELSNDRLSVSLSEEINEEEIS